MHFSANEASGFRSSGEGEAVEFDLETDPKSGQQRAARVTGPGGAPVKGGGGGEGSPGGVGFKRDTDDDRGRGGRCGGCAGGRGGGRATGRADGGDYDRDNDGY